MRLTIDGRQIPLKVFRFPGGEVQVRIEDDRKADPRAAQRPQARIDLICPYLPYARQDRVAFQGEALAASVLCGLLNAQAYRSVQVWDAHSDVSLALLQHVVHRPASDFAGRIVAPGDVVVAPDQGAAKRAGAVARLSGAPLVTAEKVRSTDTGEITGTQVHSGPIGARDFLIVDDICDGGRTFTELARVLRPLTTGQVKLYVTHGIFSAGFDALHPLIDRIFVANPFPDILPDFVQIVEPAS